MITSFDSLSDVPDPQHEKSEIELSLTFGRIQMKATARNLRTGAIHTLTRTLPP